MTTFLPQYCPLFPCIGLVTTTDQTINPEEPLYYASAITLPAAEPGGMLLKAAGSTELVQARESEDPRLTQ
ncbi:hypothetical protein TgHK011_009026 [Trichoderma gracile]|nr:hypothetical protein TgHK011_009026 [Trichoderma gracile]